MTPCSLGPDQTNYEVNSILIITFDRSGDFDQNTVHFNLKPKVCMHKTS